MEPMSLSSLRRRCSLLGQTTFILNFFSLSLWKRSTQASPTRFLLKEDDPNLNIKVMHVEILLIIHKNFRKYYINKFEASILVTNIATSLLLMKGC